MGLHFFTDFFSGQISEAMRMNSLGGNMRKKGAKDRSDAFSGGLYIAPICV